MTTEDVRNILAILQTAYPSSFKGLSQEELRNTVKLWELVFQAEPVEEVQAAVVDLIKTREGGYTPTPGEVQKRLSARRNRYEPGPEEREMVMRLAAKPEPVLTDPNVRLLEGVNIPQGPGTGFVRSRDELGDYRARMIHAAQSAETEDA